MIAIRDRERKEKETGPFIYQYPGTDREDYLRIEVEREMIILPEK